jgi:7,8-dihydropterin-6-yl-methyl-4-(beta-D-ribofuranosyl)aminobenzene 5'-phosphate synthase
VREGNFALFDEDGRMLRHCTGIESTYRLRELVGLNRNTALVNVVGSTFTLGGGIDPRLLAQ